MKKSDKMFARGEKILQAVWCGLVFIAFVCYAVGCFNEFADVIRSTIPAALPEDTLPWYTYLFRTGILNHMETMSAYSLRLSIRFLVASAAHAVLAILTLRNGIVFYRKHAGSRGEELPEEAACPVWKKVLRIAWYCLMLGAFVFCAAGYLSESVNLLRMFSHSDYIVRHSVLCMVASAAHILLVFLTCRIGMTFYRRHSKGPDETVLTVNG